MGKKSSMFKGAHPLSFHIIAERLFRFKNSSSTNQEAFSPVPIVADWVSFCFFLEWSESDVSKMGSRSFVFLRGTHKNGFFEMMNAFHTI